VTQGFQHHRTRKIRIPEHPEISPLNPRKLQPLQFEKAVPRRGMNTWTTEARRAGTATLVRSSALGVVGTAGEKARDALLVLQPRQPRRPPLLYGMRRRALGGLSLVRRPHPGRREVLRWLW